MVCVLTARGLQWTVSAYIIPRFSAFIKYFYEYFLDKEPSVLLHHAVPSDEAKLTGTYWLLKEVDGKAAEHYPNQPEAHLILKEDGQATGSDGCNNFFMSWSTQDDRITFTPGGATLRLCPQGEEQARALYEALPAVQSFRIKDVTLELMSNGRVSAVFEAVEM